MIVQMPNGEQVEFPEGTPPATVQRAIRGYLSERNAERGVGTRIARVLGMVGQGFNEGLAQTAGALPDLVGAGMRGLGVPGAPRAGQYTDWARQGIEAVTGAPQTPETTLERAAQGAGRGVADAASVMIPATAVARAAQAGGVAQGVGQALAAQPAVQTAAGAIGGAVGDATDNPLLGTAAAIATPLLGRAITPLPVSPGRQAALDTAAREGIPLSPGQASGNSALRYMEGAFENLPTTAGRQAGIAGRTQSAFNRAALSRAGIQGDSAMPDVLAANRDRLNNEFQRISAATTVRYDAPFVNQIGAAVQRYGRKLPEAQRPVFNGFVQDILIDPATGAPRTTLDGAVYQQARSDIERLRRAYQNNDPALSQAMRELRNSLDDVMGRSVSPELRADWQAARRQWGNQRTIERAIPAGESGGEGNVSALGLRSAINQYDPNAYALGRGDLAGLARLGQVAMRPVPQSGTAPRNMMIGALTGAGVAGADPATLAGAAAIPRAVQEVYNLGPVQRYLRNQAIPAGNGNLLAAIAAQQGFSEGRAAITGGAR